MAEASIGGMQAGRREFPCLIVVAGPTGSGKSELALQLAARFAGEIVNCDSVQVYRHFDIGSAKPGPDARRRIPHHLVDVVEPGELFTAGDYSRMARSVLAAIAGRGRLPVVAGGTGFYLRALLDGLAEGPGRDPLLRGRLEARRAGSLHRILSRLDPPAAARIHRNDSNKLVRALELILLTRRPLSDLYQRGREALTGFRILRIGLDPPRDELYRRIEARTLGMFEQGLVEETRSILARGVPETARPFESLGYKQALAHIRGELSLEQAVAQTQLATRRYAKRQWTWFRRDASIEWFPGFGDQAPLQALAAQRVAGFLRPELP